MAEANYHKTLCGNEFGKICKAAEVADDEHDPALHALFWLQLLACCVQKGSHPLETPSIARLLPQYDADISISWTFRANFVTPLDVLENCGIDIFADARYDSWVLEVMWQVSQLARNLFH